MQKKCDKIKQNCVHTFKFFVSFLWINATVTYDWSEIDHSFNPVEAFIKYTYSQKNGKQKEIKLFKTKEGLSSTRI
jgi:hypothetical protein